MDAIGVVADKESTIRVLERRYVSSTLIGVGGIGSKSLVQVGDFTDKWKPNTRNLPRKKKGRRSGPDWIQLTI
jgi:hypothetical protein